MRNLKVLQIAAIDTTVKKLLMPLIHRLSAEGYNVNAACSDGKFVEEMRGDGHTIYTVPIERRVNPISNLRALWCLYRLMKKEK
jgi:hypothetical protein